MSGAMKRVGSVVLVQTPTRWPPASCSAGKGKASAKAAAHMSMQSAFIGAPLLPQSLQSPAGTPCIMPAMAALALADIIMGMACNCPLAMNARTNTRLATRRKKDIPTQQVWLFDIVGASRRSAALHHGIVRKPYASLPADKPHGAPLTAGQQRQATHRQPFHTKRRPEPTSPGRRD